MVAEHPEVRLEFLVDPLGLTVGLRMVGGGGRGLDPEKAIELLHEFRDEYGPPVVKPLERESVQLPDMLVVQPRCPFGGNRRVSWDEVRPLRHGIHYNHDCNRSRASPEVPR